jgi:prevent-host-death family protein
VTAILNTHEFKARLSEFLGRVAFTRERLVVTRHGKPVAALVPMEDLRWLETRDAMRQSASAEPHPIMKAYGLWADRDDLDDLIAEIYADREKSITDTKIWD